MCVCVYGNTQHNTNERCLGRGKKKKGLLSFIHLVPIARRDDDMCLASYEAGMTNVSAIVHYTNNTT